MQAKSTGALVGVAAVTGCFGFIQACGDDSAAVGKVGDSVDSGTSTGGTTPSSSSGGTGGTAHVASGGVAHSGGANGSGGGAGRNSGGAGGDGGLVDHDAPRAASVRLELENQSGRGVTIQTFGVCGFLPGWFEVRAGDKPFSISGGCAVDASCAPVEYKTLDSGSTVSFDWTVPILVPQSWGTYHCPGAAPPNGTNVTVRFCWGPLDTSWRYVDAGGNPDFAPAGTRCVDETFQYGPDIVVKYVITEPFDARAD